MPNHRLRISHHVAVLPEARRLRAAYRRAIPVRSEWEAAGPETRRGGARWRRGARGWRVFVDVSFPAGPLPAAGTLSVAAPDARPVRTVRRPARPEGRWKPVSGDLYLINLASFGENYL